MHLKIKLLNVLSFLAYQFKTSLKFPLFLEVLLSFYILKARPCFLSNNFNNFFKFDQLSFWTFAWCMFNNSRHFLLFSFFKAHLSVANLWLSEFWYLIKLLIAFFQFAKPSEKKLYLYYLTRKFCMRNKMPYLFQYCIIAKDIMQNN